MIDQVERSGNYLIYRRMSFVLTTTSMMMTDPQHNTDTGYLRSYTNKTILRGQYMYMYM